VLADAQCVRHGGEPRIHGADTGKEARITT
jgi:hypothetical protein